MKRTPEQVAVAAGIGAGLLWFLWFMFGMSRHGSLETPGQFGDMFGSLNALFTAVAGVGVAYAMMKQKEEVDLARQAVIDAKSEVADAHRTETVRRFESTFFELLRLLNNIVASLECVGYTPAGISRPLVGRAALKQLAAILATAMYKPDGSEKQSDSTAVGEAYEAWYGSNSDDIAHFFRVVYRVLRHIDSADEHIESMHYANILRAQLSDPEVFLLCFCCFGGYGHKMKPLVEKYAMLKNAPQYVVKHAVAKDFFHIDAFRESPFGLRP